LAGAFTNAGGVLVNHIACWNGTGYAPLAQGLDDWAGTLAVFDDDAGGPDQPWPRGPVKDGGDQALFLAFTARLAGKQHLRGGDDDCAVCDRAHGDTDPFGHAFRRLAESVRIESRLEDEPKDVAGRPNSDGSDQSTAERKLQDPVQDALLVGGWIRDTQEREHRPNADEHVHRAD
jgi:hypothetical protein